MMKADKLLKGMRRYSIREYLFMKMSKAVENIWKLLTVMLLMAQISITTFDKIYDVAVVDFPAYDGTSIQARSREYFVDLEKDMQGRQRRKKLILMTYL